MSQTKTSEYTWAPGIYSPVPAEVAAEELERLRSKAGGELTASGVLGEASKKSSPIHDFFQWDDDAAANEYRLAQARRLLNGIRSVEVTILPSGAEERTPVRFYWHDPANGRGEGSYTTSARILGDDEKRDRAYREIMRQLNGMIDRLREFEGFAGVITEIERLNGN